MRVYMKGQWHEDIDYLRVELSSGRGEGFCEKERDDDLNVLSTSYTFTDGLLFRKFDDVVPKVFGYKCRHCHWSGRYGNAKRIPRLTGFGPVCPRCGDSLVHTMIPDR